MINMIESYINKLTKHDVNSFAIKNNINLTSSELDFTYTFIKNNYKEVLNNKNNFNFNKYRSNFSEDSFNKIKILIDKYSSYL